MNDLYSYIESSLDYSLYLAENDFVRTLAVIDNKAKYVTETKYEVLNEALFDTIRQYLTRVVKSISAAFKKFRETMASDKAMQNTLNLINNNKNLLTTDFRMILPDNFQLPNLDRWRNEYFEKINNEIKPFTVDQYNNWKEQGDLESPETFIQKNIQSLSGLINDKSLKENLMEKVFENPKKGEIIASDRVTVYADYLTEYNNQIEAINKQIDIFNTSSKNITDYTIKLKMSTESYLGLHNALSILNEEGETSSATAPAATTSATSPAPTVDTNTGNDKFLDADNPNGNKPNEDAKDRKYIVNFSSAYAKIMSAEMYICNEIRKSCIKVTANYINLQIKKNKEANTEEVKEKESTPQQQNNNGAPQAQT